MDELSSLLHAAKAGDEESLTRFIRSSQPEIWRFCVHLVGRELADDATQQTYVAAWRALGAFRGESSARTWLFSIARRTALELARRRDRTAQIESEAPEPPSSPSPENWTELDQLLNRLDDDRRLALLLTQVFGLSYAEAADVCLCPVGTIRSRVARAREQLLKDWRGHDEVGVAGRRVDSPRQSPAFPSRASAARIE